MILCKAELAASIDRSVFPGQQGGPLVHVIAGKAVAFKEALQPEFKAYAAQTVANAKALAEAMQAEGYPRDLRRDRHAFDSGGCVREGDVGVGGGEVRWATAGITVNKNAIPYRHESADEAERDTDWDAGADDARDEGSGDEDDCGVDCGGAGASE